MAASRKKATEFPFDIEAIAKIFGQQMADQAAHRLDVFNRAFREADTAEQRVALACAYLGGGK